MSQGLGPAFSAQLGDPVQAAEHAQLGWIEEQVFLAQANQFLGKVHIKFQEKLQSVLTKIHRYFCLTRGNPVTSSTNTAPCISAVMWPTRHSLGDKPSQLQREEQALTAPQLVKSKVSIPKIAFLTHQHRGAAVPGYSKPGPAVLKSIKPVVKAFGALLSLGGPGSPQAS